MILPTSFQSEIPEMNCIIISYGQNLYLIHLFLKQISRPTLLQPMFPLYRTQSINLHSKSIDLFIWWGSLVLILSWWRSISYRNQSIDLLCKSMDWFLYDRDLRHKGLNVITRSQHTSATQFFILSISVSSWGIEKCGCFWSLCSVWRNSVSLPWRMSSNW